MKKLKKTLIAVLDKELVVAFQTWCGHNHTNMSAEIREFVKAIVEKDVEKKTTFEGG